MFYYSNHRKLRAFPSIRPTRTSFSFCHSDDCDFRRPFSSLYLQKSWFAPDSDDEHDDDDDDRLVTREMLHRDLLQDPQVKRKRKTSGKEGYKPLDNRDHLLFSVRKVTPDPYTHNEIKQAKQKRISDGKRRRTDLDHHLTPVSKKKSGGSSTTTTKTTSRLVQSNKKDGRDVSTVLGEFQLDKSTTSGDIIVLGEKEYQVQTARCQYKYAGGQRFVMVRKILEVKEVTRVYKEEALIRQYESSPSRLPEQPPNLE
ncbi:hypothetical protein IV203_018532 [Nitzschia inconspicua]|uniref:Uncharacterized protein n=1 Tax=Nitzschia inconspicua TaxID=303405 RepID=A0A9K3Q8S9_9STRA|nr:hypothetical protein IV203_018532 [Nitzschia inconspicua]